MRIESKIISSKNQDEILIRPLGEKDGAALLHHMIATSAETHYLSRYPEEIESGTVAVKSQEQFLKKITADPRCLFLGAFHAGELVGVSNVLPVSTRKKMFHRGCVCVSVRKNAWGQGIGRSLLQTILDNAGKCGYSQLELTVLEDNRNAYLLYRKLGFQVYGTLPFAVQLKDGTYITELLMCRSV